MKRRWIILAAVLVFLVTLVAEFPAQWAAGALPRGIRCRELAGSLWSGSCVDLAHDAVDLGDLSWTVHPARLLAGRLSVDVSLEMPQRPALVVGIELRPGGAIDAHDARGSLTLDRQLVPQLPAGTAAVADFELGSLSFDGQRVTVLVGHVDVHGLRSGSTPLGDYRLTFAPAASDEPVGHIQDLGGPFEVEGSLRLNRAPGYELSVLVAPRAGAPSDAVQALKVLGSADAQGRRPFTMEGTF